MGDGRSTGDRQGGWARSMVIKEGVGGMNTEVVCVRPVASFLPKRLNEWHLSLQEGTKARQSRESIFFSLFTSYALHHQALNYTSIPYTALIPLLTIPSAFRITLSHINIPKSLQKCAIPSFLPPSWDSQRPNAWTHRLSITCQAQYLSKHRSITICLYHLLPSEMVAAMGRSVACQGFQHPAPPAPLDHGLFGHLGQGRHESKELDHCRRVMATACRGLSVLGPCPLQTLLQPFGTLMSFR